MLKEKVTNNLTEEDSLRLEIVEISCICDELKARTSSKMGPRETLLNRHIMEMCLLAPNVN